MNNETQMLENSLITATNLIESGDYEAAIKKLESLETHFPNIANIRWLIGNAFTRQSDKINAISSYAEAYKINSNLPFVEFQDNDIKFQLADVPGSDACVMFLKELYDDIYGLKQLEVLPGEVMIDVGANVGAVSIYLGKLYPKNKILAYEPCQKTFGFLTENLNKNNIQNVRPFNFAVSGDGRNLNMVSSPNNSGMASAFFTQKLQNRVLKNHGFTSELVPSKTLDQIFQENNINTCAFIKLDCEGAEFEIVKNTNVLETTKNLSVELHITDASGLPQKKSQTISEDFWSLINETCVSPPNLRIASIVHAAVE